MCCQNTTAPRDTKPLFSAEFLADRELNRTGSTPSELQAAVSASQRKKSKSAGSATAPAAANGRQQGSVIRAHSAVRAHSNIRAHSGVAAPPTPEPSVAAQGLSRSSDPDSVQSSGSTPVLGRVILDQQFAGVDVEAGQAKAADSGRGISLPFTPMAVAFKDINYYVPSPTVRRWGWVLSGCCGSACASVAFCGVSLQL